MGATVAVVSKKNLNAVPTIINVLRRTGKSDDCVYGIGTPEEAKKTADLNEFVETDLKSPLAIGHAFTKILPTDRPQPIRTDHESTLVFDGRIYSENGKKTSDADVFARHLQTNGEPASAARAFMQKCVGDYVFVVAESDRIVAGRDPLGVRPLYYGENRDITAFASECRAVSEVGIEEVRRFPPGKVAEANVEGLKFSEATSLDRIEPAPFSMRKAVGELQSLLRLAVKRRVTGLGRVALAFSGGLDSGLIASLAKREKVEVHLIHVSVENEPETEHAKEVAELLALPFHTYRYRACDVDEALEIVPQIVERSNPLDLSVGIPIYWTVKRACDLGLNVLLAGQGADELFGGYKRYESNYLQFGKRKVEEEIRHDVLTMHEVNFERDSKLCSSQGVELRVPFADADVVRFGLSLPLELKLEHKKDSLRKLVLRKTAQAMRLPESVTSRPKKAIQYATGVNRILVKRAKRKKTEPPNSRGQSYSPHGGR